MPNYFAHLVFGAKVLKELPEEMAGSFRRDRAAFNLGCLGPDPLFFYHPALPNQCRREGMRMHKRSALPVFRRLAHAVGEGVPQADSYAAGFICHFALDAACHTFIDKLVNAGKVAHLALEAELDRRLIERRGLLSAGQIYMPPITEEAVYLAASSAYLCAGPREIRKGYAAMRRDSLVFAKCYGTRGGWLADKVMGAIPACRELAGVILGPAPAPGSEAHSRHILKLLEAEVEGAAGHIQDFFTAGVAHGQFATWFQRDFSGRLTLDPA